MPKQKQKTIQEQVAWIKEHGGNRAGYVRRYGSREDAYHYGDGGEAIYAADMAALERVSPEAARLVREFYGA